MLSQLWRDENGAVITTELVLVLTIMVIGAMTGLVSLRDAIVTELADVADAIATLDQSYVIPGVTSQFAATAGTEFIDLPDQGDGARATGTPRCVIVAASGIVDPLPGSETAFGGRIR